MDNYNQKITAAAEEIDVKFLSPNGLVEIKLNNFDFTGDFVKGSRQK